MADKKIKLPDARRQAVC